MTFLKRNYRELVWVLLNAGAAAANMWIANTTTYEFAAIAHALFFGVHVGLTGFWIWAIFDNADLDSLEQTVAVLTRLHTWMETGEDPYLAEDVRRRLNDGDGA
jgi:hypothetical protein